MTAQEKTKELVEKFSNVALLDDYESKQCALIAVDEILNLPFEFESERKYWKEIQQEIEKL